MYHFQLWGQKNLNAHAKPQRKSKVVNRRQEIEGRKLKAENWRQEIEGRKSKAGNWRQEIEGVEVSDMVNRDYIDNEMPRH